MENPTCSIFGERPRGSGGAEDRPSSLGERAKSRRVLETIDTQLEFGIATEVKVRAVTVAESMTCRGVTTWSPK